MLSIKLSFLLAKNYFAIAFWSLVLKVASLAFKNFITSTSLSPFKVFKVLEQTFTLTGVPFTLIEVTCKFVQYKRFINRGFLIGPLCTIYGYGVLAIVLLIGKDKSDILSVFLKAIFVCSLLEYYLLFYGKNISCEMVGLFDKKIQFKW